MAAKQAQAACGNGKAGSERPDSARTATGNGTWNKVVVFVMVRNNPSPLQFASRACCFPTLAAGGRGGGAAAAGIARALRACTVGRIWYWQQDVVALLRCAVPGGMLVFLLRVGPGEVGTWGVEYHITTSCTGRVLGNVIPVIPKIASSIGREWGGEPFRRKHKQGHKHQLRPRSRSQAKKKKHLPSSAI